MRKAFTMIEFLFLNDLVSSYDKSNGQTPTRDDYPSCVQAKVEGFSITYVGDNIHVVKSYASWDGV